MAPDGHRRKEREQNTVKVDGSIGVPKWLSKPEKAFCKKLIKELKPIGIANKLDSLALAMLSQALHQYFNLDEQVRAMGEVLTGRDGNKVKNPLLSPRDNAWTRVIAICKEFGLTPVSRARLAIAAQAEADPFFENPDAL